ncbi:hypothetical protein HOLleu_30139 [Holothuria leucospilota]|uniref:Integrase p58-like C-terminal domain-containing protein n=1 Tax=Holothuria leucospilota TaxID=206669 RepID=A0A9Q1GZ47_HOLLE|nr:hypothetical protein HOLleu_30139 [Holothuria leucospilota]
MLSMYVHQNQKEWDVYLPLVLMAYRSSVHESSGFTPNKLMLGREVTLPIELMLGLPEGSQPPSSYSQYVYDLSEQFSAAFQLAREKSSQSQRRQKRNYDARISCRGSPFQVGDRVWLERSRRTKGLSPKLSMRWDGPYKIVKRFSDCIYRIEHCVTHRQKVTHFDKLKKCLTPEANHSDIDNDPNGSRNEGIHQSHSPATASSHDELPPLDNVDSEQSSDDSSESDNDDEEWSGTNELSPKGVRKRQPPVWMKDYFVGELSQATSD